MTEHCSTPVLRDGQMITNKETEEISDVQRKLGECSVPEVLLSGPFFVLWLESRLLLGFLAMFVGLSVLLAFQLHIWDT